MPRLRSLPHHFKMSSIYLRAGRPGRRSPSSIPNNNVFNSRSSGILQICPNSWSFLFRMSLFVVQLLVSLHLFFDLAISLPKYVCNTSSQMQVVFFRPLYLQSMFLLRRVAPISGGTIYTGVGKFGNFQLKLPYISETVRDRPM